MNWIDKGITSSSC